MQFRHRRPALAGSAGTRPAVAEVADFPGSRWRAPAGKMPALPAIHAPPDSSWKIRAKLQTIGASYLNTPEPIHKEKAFNMPSVHYVLDEKTIEAETDETILQISLRAAIP